MDGVGSHLEEASSGGSNYLNPLLISMAGIILTSLALVLYHFIVVRYCLRQSRTGRGLLLSNRLSGRSISAPGVNDKILDTIPILSFSTNKADKLFGLDQSECAICLGELEDGDKVRLLPNCRHAFHVPCIDEWFSAHTNCPVCRSPTAAHLTKSVVPLAVEDQHDGARNSMTVSRDEEVGEPVGGGSSPVRPNRFLRHCVSVALPVQGKSMCVLTSELKRSLSMDHSDHLVINIQTEPDQKPSSSSSSSSIPILMRSRSYKTRSMRKLDRMSSIITRSFSQLRIGRSSSRAGGIFPS